MEIVLASASPRRREILARILPAFSVIPSTCPETADLSQPPARIVEQLARQKAEDVYRSHTAALVLGADTVVWAGGRLLGKPKDAEDAARMLRALSGRSHWVHTGVCASDGARAESFVDSCRVTFFPIPDEEIERCIQSGEPFDKAGAYAIQGRAALWLDRLEGDYYTIMGLPVSRTARLLRSFELEER